LNPSASPPAAWPHWRVLAAAILEICELPPAEASRLAHVLLHHVDGETHPEIVDALDAGDASTAAELFVGSHVLPLKENLRLT
jgi:hypothetical protein